MADKPKEEKPYIKQVLHFYFLPELRSMGTLIYLGIFGYFTLYYIDNLILAVKFLIYMLWGHTALSGTVFLFTGMAFVVSLGMPFFMSFYAIFILHKIWDKPTWSAYVKWLVTILVMVASIFVIIASDSIARVVARQPVMQSFIEDVNLTGQI